MLIIGYKDGRPIQEKVQFKPSLYYPTQSESAYSAIDGTPIKKKTYNSIGEMRDSIKSMAGVHGHKYYGSENFIRQFIPEYYPGEISWSAKLTQLWFIDIETTVAESEGSHGFPTPELAKEKIQLITMLNQNNDKAYVFSIKPIVATNPVLRSGADFKHYESEADMLTDLIRFFQNNRIDILSGWNSEFFDIPYIVNRCTNVLGENVTKLLSPWKIIKKRMVTVNDSQKTCYDILGICHLDYLELYKKFNPGSQESFKLDYIADMELGSGKVENPFETFKEFYTGGGDVFNKPEPGAHELNELRYIRTRLGEKLKETPEDAGLKKNFNMIDHKIRSDAWNLFVEYNYRDVTLLRDLEKKMLLVELALMIAYMAKTNIADVHSSMRVWESIIYNHFRDQGIFLQANAPKKQHRSIPGAYVMDVTPGKYEWVISTDFASLYPSIMMMNNISPDTKVMKLDVTPEDLLAGNYPNFDRDKYTLSANGLITKKDREGYISYLVRQKFDQRKAFKKQMLAYETEAQAIRDELKRRGVEH